MVKKKCPLDCQEVLNCLSKTIYCTDVSSGVIEQIWNTAGNAVPHANAGSIFIGQVDPNNGLPSHINGDPDTDITVSSWVDSTSNDPNTGTDQARWYGWLYIDQDGTQLQDINGNTGERIRVWHATLCNVPRVVYERFTDTVGGDTGTGGPFITLNEGWHFLSFDISDFSAVSGVQLQNDVAGNGIFSNFSGPTSTTRPKLVCKTVSQDYVLQPFEFDCYVDLCGLPSPILPSSIPVSNSTQVSRLITTPGQTVNNVGGVWNLITMSQMTAPLDQIGLTISGGGFQAPSDGLYKVASNINYFDDNSARVSHAHRYLINNLQPTEYTNMDGMDYIRDGSGDEEAANWYEDVFFLQSGDILTLESQANSGTTNTSTVSSGWMIVTRLN